MESQIKFHSPQEISGASQQNDIKHDMDLYSMSRVLQVSRSLETQNDWKSLHLHPFKAKNSTVAANLCVKWVHKLIVRQGCK